MNAVTIHTGVNDSDYKEELKLMVSVSTPWSFKKGEHIAQLLLLPYIGFSKSFYVRHRAFGSTNKQINYSTLIQEQNRSLCVLKINGKN
jgi:deoxycytidine triphosphate deaminase